MVLISAVRSSRVTRTRERASASSGFRGMRRSPRSCDYLILPSVVEFGRARRLVAGDVLRGFESSFVLQICGDPQGTRPVK
jgi:hypothetical protein